MVPFYAKRSEVEHWEQTLVSLAGTDRIEALVTLAWFERQNRTHLAQEWAVEADELLRNLSADDPRWTWAPRLHLAQAEQTWLLGHLDESERYTNLAEKEFLAQGDQVGVGDVLWMWTSLVLDRGDKARSERCLRTALETYRAAGAPGREALTQARSLINLGFQDPEKARAETDRIFNDRNCDPGVSRGFRPTGAECSPDDGENAPR